MKNFPLPSGFTGELMSAKGSMPVGLSRISSLEKSGGAAPSAATNVPSTRTPRSSGAVTSTFSSAITKGTDAIPRSSAFRPFTARINRYAPGG